MSRCTHPETGKLLHAFELNQLDDTRREAFELHLLSCDHCFTEVSRFEPVAGLLRSDPEVKSIIQEAAFTASERVPFWSRVRSSLWPSTSLFLKPALSYFLILLLAGPAYVGIQQWRSRGVHSVHSLVFTGVRSPGGYKAAAGRPLVIMFRIEGARPGSSYRVQVSAGPDRIIYSNSSFGNVNDREMATLLLEGGSLQVGNYTIDVYDSKDNTLLHQYHFSAW